MTTYNAIHNTCNKRLAKMLDNGKTTREAITSLEMYLNNLAMVKHKDNKILVDYIKRLKQSYIDGYLN